MILAFVAGAALAAALPPATTPAPAGTPGWKLVVLGVAQDGGLPHLGCMQPRCVQAREGKRRREKVSCLGLTDGTRGYLFDATPDLAAQWHALPHVDGIFLTHGHIGHYTGLMYLGKETLAAMEMPVFCTPRMRKFLAGNGPWSLLVKDRNIVPQEIASPPGLTVKAFPVPHRDEFTDTVGYEIDGPSKKALFIPDIDKWEAWDKDLRTMVERVDYAFLDGTFFSGGELPGRDLTKVRHPFVTETLDRLRGVKTRVSFVHLNHTNPLWDDPAPVEAAGLHVANEGDQLPL